MKKFSAMAMPSKEKAAPSEESFDMFGDEGEEAEESAESEEFEAGEEEGSKELSMASDDDILAEAKKRGLV